MEPQPAQLKVPIPISSLRPRDASLTNSGETALSFNVFQRKFAFLSSQASENDPLCC